MHRSILRRKSHFGLHVSLRRVIVQGQFRTAHPAAVLAAHTLADIKTKVPDMSLHLFDRMAVEDQGEGPVVICVHGLGGSSNTFTPLMPALARCRVLRVDLPGSARSQRAEGPLSMARFADALLGLCDRLGIASAHWVAHSMGSIACQHLALRQPQRVRSLALFGPLIAPSDAARSAIRARAAKARNEGIAGMHDITEGLIQGALSADARQRQPLVVALVRESLMRQEPEAYARSCEALADAPAAAVERITAPVLLVTGDEDAVAPPQAVRAMADKLHGAASVRVVVLPRCGHWTPVERAEECGRELIAFWQAQRHSGSSAPSSAGTAWSGARGAVTARAATSAPTTAATPATTPLATPAAH